MKTLAIFTTTRADFGLFTPLLKTLQKCDGFDYKLFIGGIHQRNKFGNTIDEIKNGGYKISGEIDHYEADDSPAGLATANSKAIIKLTSVFQNEDFDFVCVLGDRFELLAIVQTAILFHKPIIHIHGGESSNGVIDEQVRHMITKAAHLHFASCETHSNNIRNMGEQKWRIFNTGALAVENMNSVKTVNKSEIFHKLKLSEVKTTVLLTFHPVAVRNEYSVQEQTRNLYDALMSFDLQVVTTAPNADFQYKTIFKEITNRIKTKNYYFFESLGVQNYLSLLKHTDLVIGNSSSGILEAPYFKIPVINIGERQDGRVRHKNIIDTGNDTYSIKCAIETALSKTFQKSIETIPYLFGNGRASYNMIEALNKTVNRQDLLKKRLDFPC